MQDGGNKVGEVKRFFWVHVERGKTENVLKENSTSNTIVWTINMLVL